jgi:hypothetical protein
VTHNRLIYKADQPPTDDMDGAERQERLQIYRKIVALSCVPCCGMCGTMRLATKPYWCLGMRICKHCLEANLISNMVLYERLWVSMSKPIQAKPRFSVEASHKHSSFVDAIVGEVFYFSNHLTPYQRLEYSSDRIDFPGGSKTIWWFWKPHLEKVLDLNLIASEAALKHKAAATVMAIVRRALVLRILTSTKDPSMPTTNPSKNTMRKRDKRTAYFKLKKIELLDRIDTYQEQRMLIRLKPAISTTLGHWEDRLVPLAYN